MTGTCSRWGDADSTLTRSVPIFQPILPKKFKPVAFAVIEFEGAGKLLGVVYAANEVEAHRLAVIDFKIRRPELVRLLIRRA